MSRQHKILLACALAFAGLVPAVLLLGDASGTRHDSGFARRYRAPAWLQDAGALFAGHVPRIALPASPLNIAPGAALGIDVGGGEASFRSARLRLERGDAIDIDYEDLAPEGMEALRHQRVSLPHDDGGDPMQTSIVALKHGGRLTLHCRGHALCVLTVK